MKYFIILLSSIAFSATAQQKILIVRDTAVWGHPPGWPHERAKMMAIILSNDTVVFTGKFIVLGKGTLPNGDYNYIATPSNTMEAKLKGSTTRKLLQILEIRRKGNKAYGYKYIIKTEGNYNIQLEDAIATGEIVI